MKYNGLNQCEDSSQNLRKRTIWHFIGVQAKYNKNLKNK